MPLAQKVPIKDRKREVLRVAEELFRQRPDWVVFFREILGVEGAARLLFPKSAEMAAFEKSPEWREIQKMLAELRRLGRGEPEGSEAIRTITVRIPASLHESLLSEANRKRTSMNKLCISKLLQMVGEDYIPEGTTKKVGLSLQQLAARRAEAVEGK